MHGQVQNEKFMRIALEEAHKGLDSGELPIGAVLVLDDEVLAQKFCKDITNGFLAHAEILTLTEVDSLRPSFSDRRKMTLYTTLEPCLMCLGASMSFFLGNIVYGLKAPADGAVGKVGSLSFGDASYSEYKVPSMIGGVLKDEAKVLFESFTKTSENLALKRFAAGIVSAN